MKSRLRGMVIAQSFTTSLSLARTHGDFSKQETVFLAAPIFAGANNTHETYQTLRKRTDVRRQGRVQRDQVRQPV